MTIECTPDFFIYVPTVNDVKMLTPLTHIEGEEVDSRQVDTTFNLTNKHWVKIALDGPIVVYARLRNTFEDV